MATAKEQLLEFVQNLPDHLSQDEVERTLLHSIQAAQEVRLLVERAEQDIAAGRTVSHEELKKKWGF